MSKLPADGLQAILHLKKIVEPEDSANSQSSKYVRLRFTRKQYEAFINACSILDVVSSHEDFNRFVQKALDADVKPRFIASQFVNPIVEAPTRIADPALKSSAKKSGDENHIPKITYFTKPIQPTDVCRELYSRVADSVDGEVKYNIIKSDTTCITDIRRMLSRYIANNELRHTEGTIYDNFLQTVAHNTFREHKHDLFRIEDTFVIPKGNRKIITDIVNEIAFNK